MLSSSGRRYRSEPFRPVPLERFGGLNLRDDPQEVGWSGAVDLLNVDFDRRGRLRQRDGYAVFGPSVSPRYVDVLAEYPRLNDFPHLIMGDSGGTTHAVDATGTSVATTALRAGSVAIVGTTSATYAYVSDANLGSPRRWDGTSWSTPAGMPTASRFAVQQADNRLVAAYIGSSNPSRVQFSGAGAPETWGADDYVDLTPGDGESISALVAWNGFVFAFKPTKFFVFYGNSTDSTGGTVFNYRPVVTGGTVQHVHAVAGKEGVYFLTASGLYRTTGGQPTKVGTELDPFWRGVPHATLGTHESNVDLGYFDGRLFASILNTDGAVKTLVFDLETEKWTAWDLGLLSPIGFRPNPGDRQELFFGVQTGVKAGRMSSAYTLDDAAPIDSYYMTGFSDLGEPMTEKITREVLLDGIGSVDLSVAVNDSTSYNGSGTVTLGTSPAVGSGRRRYSHRGRNFSLKFADISGGAWSVSRAVAHVTGQSFPGKKSPD